ncbi:unnamed protein product [Schistosoma margrebowiei]|uniref:Uncharacterized protein n=1 Tax=Schistosoma margrebowiei TaxID=48269 RepID=A0A183MRX1_9TREM|nr:unnamed protein product [Schistosoma margrebowiei]
MDSIDDLVLLYHTYRQMEWKKNSVLTTASASVGLKSKKRKTNILKYNKEITNNVTHDKLAVAELENST